MGVEHQRLFETKMGVALMVVPGIAAGWIWIAPRGRVAALRQLIAGGAAMIAVGGAWPLLVALTPAAGRPWISGTSDNSILSLIFGYNGLGRLAGQSGGPGAGGGPGGNGGLGGGTLFGGATGPFRLLQSGLGDQAGWLIGLALVSGLALVALTRLRRHDPRTGWLIVVGGAFLSTAFAFSFAQGIFHPYYVSLLAPFSAALVGAGVGQMLPAPLGVAGSGASARWIAPIAIGAGAVTELVVLRGLSGRLPWASPLVVALGGGCALVLGFRLAPRMRAPVVGLALLALLAAPATWAAQTLGHATNGTFPSGGPASASLGPGAGGGFGAPTGAGRGPGAGAGFGGGRGPGFGAPPGGASSAMGAPPRSGGPFGGEDATLTAALRYARAHGGGTVGVSSQSSAAAAILSSGADVAGLGGFSGRESSVTAAWIASEVRSGRLRWVLAADGQGLRSPGDARMGSRSAIAVVEKACRPVRFKTSAGTTVAMYDCFGRAAAVLSSYHTRVG